MPSTLTTSLPVEFLSRIIKKKRSGQISMEFSQKLNLLGLFDITRNVTTNGVKIQPVAREDQITYGSKLDSQYRTAVGKLLWKSQLRDDIKYLSRSFRIPCQILRMSISRISCIFSRMSIRFSRLHSGSDCLLLGFRLGRMSVIKKINKWIIVDTIWSQ